MWRPLPDRRPSDAESHVPSQLARRRRLAGADAVDAGVCAYSCDKPPAAPASHWCTRTSGLLERAACSLGGCERRDEAVNVDFLLYTFPWHLFYLLLFLRGTCCCSLHIVMYVCIFVCRVRA